jgi:hypothetical protein
VSVRWRRIVTWSVGLAVAGGGVTFLFKLYEFVETASRGDLPGFAFATVFSYFVVTLGFLCLAAWAFLKGHYRDIEEPKHRLLETEEELDRQETMRGAGPPLRQGGAR